MSASHHILKVQGSALKRGEKHDESQKQWETSRIQCFPGTIGKMCTWFTVIVTVCAQIQDRRNPRMDKRMSHKVPPLPMEPLTSGDCLR